MESKVVVDQEYVGRMISTLLRENGGRQGFGGDLCPAVGQGWLFKLFCYNSQPSSFYIKKIFLFWYCFQKWQYWNIIQASLYPGTTRVKLHIVYYIFLKSTFYTFIILVLRLVIFTYSPGILVNITNPFIATVCLSYA